jgi:hypothetical protein
MEFKDAIVPLQRNRALLPEICFARGFSRYFLETGYRDILAIFSVPCVHDGTSKTPFDFMVRVKSSTASLRLI